MMKWIAFRIWVIRWLVRCRMRYAYIPWPGMGTLREYFDDDISPMDAILSDESYWEP